MTTAPTDVDSAVYPLYERLYLVFAATFVVLLVLTNIVGIKLFRAPLNPDFALTTGILTYPFTFLVTDIVSEIWGKKRADFMVLLGFLMSALMLLIIQLALHAPPHPFWVPATDPAYVTEAGYQRAFESVFSLNGLLLFGSMLAYAAAQLTDNWLYHFFKRLTKGRMLWLRNNGSTWVSQLVDTGIVNSILFFVGFGMDFKTGIGIMATIYVYKLAIAALDTPLVYLGVWGVKRMLGVDFDQEVRA